MNVLQKHTASCVTLKERSVQYRGLSLGYRLRAICDGRSTRYAVEVTLIGRERACAALGNDIETALAHFHAICRGAVTPCTLSEVVCEMQIGN